VRERERCLGRSRRKNIELAPFSTPKMRYSTPLPPSPLLSLHYIGAFQTLHPDYPPKKEETKFMTFSMETSMW